MDLIEQIQEMGYEVRSFGPAHFLVESTLECSVAQRGVIRWRDKITGEHGKKPPDQFLYFISYRMEARSAEKSKASSSSSQE